MTLLAILVGFPAVAGEVFRELLESDEKSWARFRKTSIDARADARSRGVDKAAPDPPVQKAKPATKGTAASKAVRSAEASPEDDEPRDDWDRLSARLTDLEKRCPLSDDLVKYREWAELVGRFSFDIGRIATVAASQGQDEEVSGASA